MGPRSKVGQLSAAQLFDRYGDVVFRRCRQLLKSESAANDAVQEVFLRVLTRGDSFRGDASPLTWLYAIATTHCLQQLRNAERRQAKLDALFAGTSADPTLALENRLAALQLLEESDPEVQQMACLRYVDGLTAEEIARVVGRSRRTVTDKLQRFLQRARARLNGGAT